MPTGNSISWHPGLATGFWKARSVQLKRATQLQLLAGPRYGALFSLAQSPVDPSVIWAGADDGPIYVSRDGGQHWRRVDGRLPAGSYKEGFVSKIEPWRTAAGTAYVAFDLYYHDNFTPYLFTTTDFDQTWTTITSDLPMWGST